MKRSVKSEPTEEPDIDRVKEEISALTRDLALLIDKLKTAAADGSVEAVRESVEQLGDRARMLHETLGAQGERSANAVTRQIEAHPVVSLLVAFGVGFLASRLLAR